MPAKTPWILRSCSGFLFVKASRRRKRPRMWCSNSTVWPIAYPPRVIMPLQLRGRLYKKDQPGSRLFHNVQLRHGFVCAYRRCCSTFKSLELAIDAAIRPRISTRHNGIPGRARLEVVGLRGNDGLRDLLETAGVHNGIRSISASSVTGNALVFYDPDKALPDIVGYLEIIIQQPPTPAPGNVEPRESGGVWGFLRGLFGRPAPASPPELTTAVTRRRAGPPGGQAPEVLPQPWHTAAAEDIAKFWRTSGNEGLTQQEAAVRLKRYGTNVLSPLRPRPALAMLAEQFLSLPVMLLVGSAALSIATGGIADALVIGAVVILNAGIGFATEYKADRTIMSLLELSEPEATVIREGVARIVAGDEVVPGDLLVLRRGEPVVADARLMRCARLTIDEAALTGESMPLEKRPAEIDV